MCEQGANIAMAVNLLWKFDSWICSNITTNVPLTPFHDGEFVDKSVKTNAVGTHCQDGLNYNTLLLSCMDQQWTVLTLWWFMSCHIECPGMACEGQKLEHFLIDSVNDKECNLTVQLLFQMHGGSAKFSDLYELQEDIGVGSYSICKRCVHRVSAMDYAVKVASWFLLKIHHPSAFSEVLNSWGTRGVNWMTPVWLHIFHILVSLEYGFIKVSERYSLWNCWKLSRHDDCG